MEILSYYKILRCMCTYSACSARTLLTIVLVLLMGHSSLLGWSSSVSYHLRRYQEEYSGCCPWSTS